MRLQHKTTIISKEDLKDEKELLALLLASSIALMNVAPAYGTDIFTDPDNAVNEDVISVPEELDNNEEFNDTEDEFTSEQTDDDFFSDEKEMPSVQEGTRWLQMQVRE